MIVIDVRLYKSRVYVFLEGVPTKAIKETLRDASQTGASKWMFMFLLLGN